jgi:hypothetical protein
MPDLFEIVDAGFLRAQEEPRATTLWWHPLPDGRVATVAGDRLAMAPGSDSGGDDAYVYGTPMAAVLAAARWIEAGCAGEPEGWTHHPTTSRTRHDGARGDAETAWVCPRHPDRLPRFDRGRLFCVRCGRVIVDAIRVPWPPPNRQRPGRR